MKLTKLEHACVLIENNKQKKIIIDPGVFTNLPQDLNNISIVVVTHSHPDHFDPGNLSKIKQVNPKVKIYSTKEVSQQLDEITIPDALVRYEEDGFALNFYGSKHKPIRNNVAILDNIGVIINDKVAYPGDSFDYTENTVDYLLTPFSGPWLHVNEASEFVINSKAKVIIPTHDILLSKIGKQIYSSHIEAVSKQSEKIFHPLEIGETLQLRS